MNTHRHDFVRYFGRGRVVAAGPVGQLDEALAFVNSEGSALDGAVLDITLHGRTFYPIADLLMANGVKFVFVTGYSERALDAAYRTYPRCEKPFEPEAILTKLAAVFWEIIVKYKGQRKPSARVASTSAFAQWRPPVPREQFA